ncbi:hypothetical protein ACCO45_005862 [Purpureocillium lilacinum]|uniref:Uncharacterized protein n=1 Tax=Purpureocillium lilacinum TaxID=33203 RepID=A0ACC4DWN9_PURLI
MIARPRFFQASRHGVAETDRNSRRERSAPWLGVKHADVRKSVSFPLAASSSGLLRPQTPSPFGDPLPGGAGGKEASSSLLGIVRLPSPCAPWAKGERGGRGRGGGREACTKERGEGCTHARDTARHRQFCSAPLRPRPASKHTTREVFVSGYVTDVTAAAAIGKLKKNMDVAAEPQGLPDAIPMRHRFLSSFVRFLLLSRKAARHSNAAPCNLFAYHHLPCKEFLLHILLCQVLRRSRRASGTMRWQLCGRRDDGIGPTSGQVRHAVALYPVVADGDEWRRRLDARHDSAGAIP